MTDDDVEVQGGPGGARKKFDIFSRCYPLKKSKKNAFFDKFMTGLCLKFEESVFGNPRTLQ